MLALLVATLLPIVAAQFLGPAIIEIDRMTSCGEDKLGFKADVKMKKANRTHYMINIDFNFPFDIGDKVQIDFNAAKWGDGGYKPHYADLNDTNACSFLEKFGKDLFDRIRENMGLPNKCPMAAGEYKLKNFIVDSEFELPLPYGKYRVNWLWTTNSIQFFCLEYYISVDPNKKVKTPPVV